MNNKINKAIGIIFLLFAVCSQAKANDTNKKILTDVRSYILERVDITSVELKKMIWQQFFGQNSI